MTYSSLSLRCGEPDSAERRSGLESGNLVGEARGNQDKDCRPYNQQGHQDYEEERCQRNHRLITALS